VAFEGNDYGVFRQCAGVGRRGVYRGRLSEGYRAADEAEGSKWTRGGYGAGDEDDDEFTDEGLEFALGLGGAEGVGPLDADSALEVSGHLVALEARFFSMGDYHKGRGPGGCSRAYGPSGG
jgi:hypothetical protein